MTDQIITNIGVAAAICFILACLAVTIFAIVAIVQIVSLKKTIQTSIELNDERMNEAPMFIASMLPVLGQFINPKPKTLSGFLKRIIR